MAEPTVVYLFRSEAIAPGSSTNVCAAPTHLAATAYGGGGHHDHGGVQRAFGGYALYRDDETGDTFLAVRGVRNASRFRAALRRRGPITIMRGPPPARLAWLCRTGNHNERASMLCDLTRVGPTQALGYLPLQTNSRVLSLNVEDVIANARLRGLAVLKLGPEECCIESGALYVYDPVALDAVIGTSVSTLVLSGFPTLSEAFVRTVAYEWLDLDHPVMPVIKAAFADMAQPAMG